MDSTEKVRVLIQSGDPVIVSIAPSFIANYNGVGIEAMRKALSGIVEQLINGVPATLTVKDGKGTLIIGDKEDEDEEAQKAE